MTVEPVAQWTVRGRGADLAVYRYGTESPAAPTVLLVHGYPDDHRLWDAVVTELGGEARLVSYDTRVAGRSRVDDPRGRAPFRMELLADDLYAVLDSLPTRGPVHLVAHDWGSVQSWEALSRPRASTAFASYLSISGPNVDHLREWNNSHLTQPGAWPTIARQLMRSWYVFGFSTPGARRLVPSAYARMWRAEVRPERADLVRGGELYRANILRRMISGPKPSCLVPTTLVVPSGDRFLSPRLVEGVGDWIPDLTVVGVDAGHWWPRTHPVEAAELIRKRFPQKEDEHPLSV